MRRIHYAVIVIGSALLLAVGLASADQPAPASRVIGAEASPSSCQEQGAFVVAQAEGQQAPSGDAQERAVPRMGVPDAPVQLGESAILQGNTLQAKPGYVLEVQPDTQEVVVRPRTRRPATPVLALKCVCDVGTSGSLHCIVQGTTSSLECKTKSVTDCGKCGWKSITIRRGGEIIQ